MSGGPRGNRKSEIAEQSGVSKNGGVDEHIDGFVALGLLREQAGRFRPGDPAAALYACVLELIEELEHVPERRIDDLLEPADVSGRPVEPQA
jgi:hypothetical protein